MADLHFTSTLAARHLDALETLMFFNPLQQAARADIVDSIERFGAPQIRDTSGQLRVTLGKHDAQVLFAIAGSGTDAELAGLVLYLRVDLETVVVVHLAVAEPFAAGGPEGDAMVVLRLLNAVRASVRRLKGVRSVTIMSPVAGRQNVAAARHDHPERPLPAHS